MKPFTFEHWHVWQGTAHILLSDERVKKLYYFDDTTKCINWLWLEGHKDASRALNAHVKAG
jgi:hypothetical protein